MGLYRRGGSPYYWMSFTIKGRKIYESTKTSNKKLASKIHAKRWIEIVEGRFSLTSSHKKTLRDMIEKYETEYLMKKISSEREKGICFHLKAYFKENTDLEDISKNIGDYESFRTAKGIAPATVVKELGLLRRMFNIAIRRWRWITDNPVSQIEMPKVSNERIRYLSNEELDHLIMVLNDEAIPTWLKQIVLIALNTGLRKSNILNLRWSQVNLISRLIVIDSLQMKNKENIAIPLTQEAFKTLKELQKVSLFGDNLVFHCRGKGINSMMLHRTFKKACRIARIEDFRFHDLRHTFASYLRQKGVDLHTISKLLGHKDLRMTTRYAHLNVDSLRRAISVLDKREDSYNLVTLGNIKSV